MKQRTLTGGLAAQSPLRAEPAPPRRGTIRAASALADPCQYSLQEFAHDEGEDLELLRGP
jgi:hypothetical protein